MDLSNLKPAAGSVKVRKRIARGTGSGKGGTATRGHNGAKSRSGYSQKVGFEGGQMPLQRRVPKFGFKNINRIDYKGINVETLQQYVEAGKLENTITVESLIKAGLVNHNDLIKILGNGELKATLNVTVHKFTASAAKAVTEAGGEANTL